MPGVLRGLYRFGPYRLDPGTRTLTRHADPVGLPPKTFDLLLVLVESGGRLLGKRELMDALWSDAFVEEASLAFQVSTLRKALGDEGSAWIETVPKHGYRFTAPIERPDGEGQGEVREPAQSPERSQAARAGIRAGLVIAAAAFLVLLVVAAIAWKTPQTQEGQSGDAVQFTVSPADGVVLTELDLPFVSPDGRKLVYTGGPAGGPRVIWLRPLDSIEARPLPGTEGALVPSWSPDSRSIAFFAGGMLKRMDLWAEAPITVCPVRWMGGHWYANGQILFGDPDLGLRQVSIQGFGLKDVLRLDKARTIWFLAPQMLPDGRHFLYTNRGREFGESYLELGRLDSSEIVRLATGASVGRYTPSGHLLFGRGRSLLAQPFDPRTRRLSGDAMTIVEDVATMPAHSIPLYSVSGNGVLAYRQGGPRLVQPTWYDRSGRILGKAGEAGEYRQMAVSPDARWAVLERIDPIHNTLDLWLLDISKSTLARLTFDPANDISPVWSPDSREIVFSSNRQGTMDIFRRAIDGREEILVYLDEHRKIPHSWTSDGTLLHGIIGYSVRTLSLTGNGKVKQLFQPPDEASGFKISPDGRMIAYASLETGQFQLYLASYPSFGNRRQISADRGVQPFWRSDGRELFYLTMDGKLMAVAVGGGSAPEAGRPRLLFQTRLHPNHFGVEYGASPDGQRFLLAEPVEVASKPFQVVLNWPTLMQRRSGAKVTGP